MALAADLSPKESRGLVISTIPTSFQIGYAVGPTAMGSVAGISSLETMFFACGLSMAFALIIIAILLRTRQKSGVANTL